MSYDNKKIIVWFVVILGVISAGYVGYVLKGYSSSNNKTTTSSDGTALVSSGSTLNLANKGLSELPKDKLNDTSVTSLILSHNNLTSLPSEIGKLTRLEVLLVDNNKFEGALPGEIRKMTNLKTIDASYNKITGIPAEIGQLKKLTTLNYSYNQLDTMPNEIANASSLQTLNLSYNNYTAIPNSILTMTWLKTLNLKGNPLSSSELDNARQKLPNTTITF